MADLFSEAGGKGQDGSDRSNEIRGAVGVHLISWL